MENKFQFNVKTRVGTTVRKGTVGETIMTVWFEKPDGIEGEIDLATVRFNNTPFPSPQVEMGGILPVVEDGGDDYISFGLVGWENTPRPKYVGSLSLLYENMTNGKKYKKFYYVTPCEGRPGVWELTKDCPIGYYIRLGVYKLDKSVSVLRQNIDGLYLPLNSVPALMSMDINFSDVPESWL